jgi:hypothetical protein
MLIIPPISPPEPLPNLLTPVLPPQVKYLKEIQLGKPCHVVAIELQPQIYKFGWYSYDNAILAFPYTIITSIIYHASPNDLGYYTSGGIDPTTKVFCPSNTQIFFSNEPITTTKHKVSTAPLLNTICNYNSPPAIISPICFQLRSTACLFEQKQDAFSKTITELINKIIDAFKNNRFNHDYSMPVSSFFKLAKPELYPISNWITNTKENPNFILNMPWDHSILDLNASRTMTHLMIQRSEGR